MDKEKQEQEIEETASTNQSKKPRKLKARLLRLYYLAVWNSTLRKDRCVQWFRRYAHALREIFILIVTIVAAWSITQFIDISSISTNNLASCFVAVGAMIGGVIAIVFSLSIFAQQSSADLYSSQYFEVYAHDWKEKMTYSLIVLITIAFFVGGIIFYGNANLATVYKYVGVYASLILIGTVFILVDWQYRNVTSKANPIKALNFLERQSDPDRII